MRMCATVFAVILLLPVAVVVYETSQLNFINIIATDKMVQFVILNSLLLICVGIFGAVFHNRLKLYFKNYRREKEI
ncbi:MAG: hypothetical protein PHV37_00940 [Candidatus Gastranaerophilales bacterium]|nr:hypothetical protein [Candidatus Gastranaerophilales bacterium]